MWQYELEPAYEITTAPSAAVLTAANLNAQLRVDGSDEDTLVGKYIAAATELVETDSRLFLRPAELTLRVDRWPRSGPLLIARGPLTAVSAVRYVDADGDEQEWDEDEYTVDLVSKPGRLAPAFGCSWPVLRAQQHAVMVDLEVGFPDGQCPEIALQMIRLLVGHWFLNREAVGTLTREAAFAYTALLERLSWD
jgi:uncharacterized phiE125 gp8 family phage protein